MTIKRAPAKRSPRHPARRRESLSSREGGSPRILSADEKRELILLHAAKRHAVDPVQRMSLWAGVTVSALFVAAVWASTISGSILNSWAKPVSQDIADVLAEKTIAEEDVFSPENDLAAQIREASENAGAARTEDALVTELAAQLLENSTSTNTLEATTSTSGQTTSTKQTTP